MEIRQRLTHYGAILSPLIPGESEVDFLRSVSSLDSHLYESISALSDLGYESTSISQSLFLLRMLQDHKVERLSKSENEPEAIVYRDIAFSVATWIEQIFKNINLSVTQKKLLRIGLFSNEFGRSGLSMVTEAGSTFLSEKAKIKPIHFAQSIPTLPNKSKMLLSFKKRSAYIRPYFDTGNSFFPAANSQNSDAYVMCSFAGTSIALITKLEKNSEHPEILSHLRTIKATKSTPAEKAEIWSNLREGIHNQGGLIYQLARNISS